MAIYKEDIVEIELQSGTIHRSFLNHSIGSGDKKANRFGVELFRNGAPVSAESSVVTGVFMAPDWNNYGINETSWPGSTGKEGNKAWVQLPEICYAVTGQFCLAIKLSGGGVEGTMRIIDGTVSETGEAGAVVPTSTIPTTEEIIAAYEEAVEVIAGSVRFDASQTLSDAEAETARENIEAAGIAQVVRIDDDQSLTAAEKAQARGNIETAWVGTVETLNGYNRNIVSMESGTFSDSDGVTKASNVARQRNKIPMYIGNVTRIEVPDGYELYCYYLNDSMTIIGRTSTWQTGHFNAFRKANGAVYINFAVRSISSPTSDISSADIRPAIVWDENADINNIKKFNKNINKNLTEEIVSENKRNLLLGVDWELGGISTEPGRTQQTGTIQERSATSTCAE